MQNTRTLTDLRNELKGKIYIYLDNAELCKEFLQNSENEGYRFGEICPTENHCSDIIALEDGKKLSYVGFVGHVAFKCGNGLHRIDYRKFIDGDTDYLYR